MENLSLEARESLLATLEGTRKITRLTTVPVQFGLTKLPPTALTLLKNAIASDEVRRIREKPAGPVFLVLGFADAAGDPDKNFAASQSRADLVAATLKEKYPVNAPVHAIAMGSSNLPAPDKVEENRVAEVWAIWP
jgi:outer membrane protein OmpA-like peptidoglycan-associated protein